MHDSWTATYRLQLHRGFDLFEAAAVVPYLARLGISHVYLSPVLQATPGSTHGYDVADPTRISDDLGGERGWQALQRTVRGHGLKVLLDIVPNHMSATCANPWWEDVLARGPFSAHRHTFDIDPRAFLGRWSLALCTLGRPYAQALEAGELLLDGDGELPRVRYFDQTWPVSPGSWHLLLPNARGALAAMLAELATLHAEDRPETAQIARLDELAAAAHGDITSLAGKASWRAAVQQHCAAISGDPARLHAVLEQQYYRLCWWKIEGEVVNYRRFFNIGTLVGLAVERPEVFEASHARIRRMIDDGDIDGLRVDHPDGLRDPLGYFGRLRALFPSGRLYAEKILDAEEELPASWPIQGTVGYDFLDRVGRLWMDEQKSDALTAAYHDFTGHTVNYPALVRRKKMEIAETSFDADLRRLTTLAIDAAGERCRSHDLSRRQMQEALRLVTCALSVYRTYLRPGSGAGLLPANADETASDRKRLADAIASARTQPSTVQPPVFDALETVMLGEGDDAGAELLARWQQLTPAVMAKGAEDTTFYCFDRLLSCNEVGSQPSLLGIPLERFHQYCAGIAGRWPSTLLATSTHDNKRSEDVRTRIDVLTEAVDRWAAALRSWPALNQAAWKGRQSDRHAEYLLYQTLLGAWPIDGERLWQFMQKSCREAKIFTSWHEPNEEYELGIREFVEGVLANAEFLAELETFVEQIRDAGRINSMAQTLIKMTAPGTPDFYQGTERWDLSLVDPDNRRPVAFDELEAMLERGARVGARDVMSEMDTGLPKLWMIAAVLSLRRERPDLFAPTAAYHPRFARGAQLSHLVIYMRGEELMVVVPRFTLDLAGQWQDTVVALPEGRWENVFTGAVHAAEVAPPDLLAEFPVALLLRKAAA